jgi:uncharacterized protein (DUF1800 family)
MVSVRTLLVPAVAIAALLGCSAGGGTGTQKPAAAAAGPAEWTNDLAPITAADWSYERAAHLLERAGFGGTPQEVAALAAMTPEQAVDHLVDFAKVENVTFPPFEESGIFAGMEVARAKHLLLPQMAVEAQRTSTLPGIKPYPRTMPLNDQPRSDMVQFLTRARSAEWARVQQWLANRALTTKRPLEEKLTLFWHGHFASENAKVIDYQLMLNQFDMLRTHANGNFRDLLLGITRDPAMLVYLDGRLNVKDDTNENYAREILELFGLGIGNYTEQDIKESARALTGWVTDNFSARLDPARFHDGVKTILGETGNFDDAGVVDVILRQKACGDFIAGKLYRFFVRPEVDQAVLAALSQRLRDDNYELKPLLRTIFLSRDFYSPASYATQIKSPVQYVLSTYRRLGLPEVPGAPTFAAATGQLGQQIGLPPNVSGWAGDKDGGLSWVNPSTLLARGNFVHGVLLPGERRQAAAAAPGGMASGNSMAGGAPAGGSSMAGGEMAGGNSMAGGDMAAGNDMAGGQPAGGVPYEDSARRALERALASGPNEYVETLLQVNGGPPGGKPLVPGVGEPVVEGSKPMSLMNQFKGEAVNPELGVYNASLRMQRVMKRIPPAPAQFSAAALVREDGAQTAGDVVDAFARRFLLLPLAPADRDAIVGFLRERLGGDALDLAGSQTEQALRETLHLILSTPEYQMG